MEGLDEAVSVDLLIQGAYRKLKEDCPLEAMASLDEAIKADFNSAEARYAHKCLGWWLEKFKALDEFEDPYDQGGYILAQWKSYEDYRKNLSERKIPDSSGESGCHDSGERFDNCQYAIKRFVYGRALRSFTPIVDEKGINTNDPGLLLQVGRCCKGMGEYERAQKFLEQAIRFKREEGGALAELGDVKALLNDTRAAKVFFREAFFVDPQGVKLWSMESDLIKRLAATVEKMGYKDAELLEWIPVYGVLLGIFNISRELKPAEVGKLNQDIWALEIETRSGGDKAKPLVPRLVNKYLALMYHLRGDPGKAQAVSETMMKIKLLTPDLYARYLA